MSVITNYLNDKEENTWQKASATLDATSRIYGYRVDSVHSEAFKFLGGLNRAEHKPEEEEIVEGEEDVRKIKEKEKLLVRNLILC